MEQEKKECQLWPGDAMTLRDGSGAYGGGLGCGDTHRCVSERSPLRAFLEMEPILLSSMKLWKEGGVRERPPVLEKPALGNHWKGFFLLPHLE